MNPIKARLFASLAVLALAKAAIADEHYVNITTAGSQTAVNLSAANSALAINYQRVVHGLILTNADTVAVTVTLSKITNTSSTTNTGSGKNIKTTTSISSSAPRIASVVIIPASTTQVITLPSGLAFSKPKNNVVDDMEVELTTTSTTANVYLTIDYQDIEL